MRKEHDAWAKWDGTKEDADRIRAELAEQGIVGGLEYWHALAPPDFTEEEISRLIY